MNVVFDGDNLLIKVNQGVTTLDIQTDIYSAWKEWIQTGNNSKFLPCLRTIGGDPTIEQKVVAPYFFLMNGWKIKPYSWTHTLNLVGNLFVDEPETYGSNIVVPPDGNYTVLVNMSTTSDASKLLVGSGVTQQDKLDIASLVEQQTAPIKAETDKIANHKLTSEETQGQITELHAKVDNVENSNEGRRKIEGDYLIIYKKDDPNVIFQKFRLIKDSQGNVVERVLE